MVATSTGYSVGLAAVLELAYRADSNSAAREGLWVRVPPAVPGSAVQGIRCRATPADATACVDDREIDGDYAYLFGLYLGDGMLSPGRRHVWHLRISLDARYPAIIERGRAAIVSVSGRRAGATARPGCVEISGYWKHWPCLFPQHGRGPKHLRPVGLEGWQRHAIVSYPGPFVTGLIHSDGCRVINRVKGHAYPRYFFSNLSPDIRSMFQDACALLEVDTRAAGRRNIAVSRRASVEILDALVGPKA
jgi:hypothetical protein